MSSLQVFRSVVAASFLTLLAAVIYSSWAESGFSQEWREVMAWNGNGGVLPNNIHTLSPIEGAIVVIMALTMIVTLVNEVLFFFCWRYSRTIYLWTCLMDIGFTLFIGLSIMTPIEGALYQASTFLSGVALALAYCSPVSQFFSQPRKVPVRRAPRPPGEPSDSHLGVLALPSIVTTSTGSNSSFPLRAKYGGTVINNRCPCVSTNVHNFPSCPAGTGTVNQPSPRPLKSSATLPSPSSNRPLTGGAQLAMREAQPPTSLVPRGT